MTSYTLTGTQLQLYFELKLREPLSQELEPTLAVDSYNCLSLSSRCVDIAVQQNIDVMTHAC